MKIAELPLVRPLGRSAGQLVDRILCVAGAVLFSQAPEFMQQYLQRLEGHLDEARRQLAALTRAAAESGLTLDQLVADVSRSADPAIARLGGVAGEAATRVAQLQSADTALRHASVWARPFEFVAHVEPDIARGTWSVFRPAVPTTLEGLGYAAAGMLVALAVFHGGISYPLRRAARRRAARRDEPLAAVR